MTTTELPAGSAAGDMSATYVAGNPSATYVAGNPSATYVAGNPSATYVAGLADWRDYFALLKPRVMTLVVFSAACAMAVAPGHIHPVIGFVAMLCVAVGAGAAGALNQWYEADIDALMKRTANRPLPAGRIERRDAFTFGVLFATGSVAIMGIAVNWLASAILALSILFYVLVYTIGLKRRTPQNIVIGGAAGAFPPLIGWAAVTGDVSALPLLLFALIFLWTPPHFWALALFMEADYSKAGVPMLPVTDGPAVTRRQILLYTLVLVPVSLVPWALGLTGWIYGGTALVFGAGFIACAVAVWRNTATLAADMAPEKRMFRFSLLYLFMLFAALVVDYLVLPWSI